MVLLLKTVAAARHFGKHCRSQETVSLAGNRGKQLAQRRPGVSTGLR